MSTTLECQACGGKVGLNAEKCIHCGEPNPQGINTEQPTNEPEKKKSRTFLTAILIVIYPLIPVAIYFMWKDKNWVKPIGSAMGIFLCAFMVFSLLTKNKKQPQ